MKTLEQLLEANGFRADGYHEHWRTKYRESNDALMLMAVVDCKELRYMIRCIGTREDSQDACDDIQSYIFSAGSCDDIKELKSKLAKYNFIK